MSGDKISTILAPGDMDKRLQIVLLPVNLILDICGHPGNQWGPASAGAPTVCWMKFANILSIVRRA